MNNFVFISPTEFVFGKGTENKVGSLATKYGANKVLIVYGKGHAVKSGLLQRVEDSLMNEGIMCYKIGDIAPNPTDDKVYEGIEIARTYHVDFMIAVGGGSVIDTAKAIAAGVPYEGDFWDFFQGTARVKQALPIGVVLTIPAAGSEASGNSVITKRDGLHKLSIRTDRELRPKFSIMNPELTISLSPWQTACGIADMMSHIMERYFTNTTDVELTDRLCEGTLKAIIQEAHKVMLDPSNYEVRANIMWAATIAHNGLCGVGREEDWASHFLEHEVSAVYGVTHGAGLAVIQPAWLNWVSNHRPEKVAQFAERVWNVEKRKDLRMMTVEGVFAYKKFLKSIGLPTSFRELGIENPDIDKLVYKLHEDKGEFIGNYVQLDRRATREIYELAK
ncbi:MAG: iron-containing alcohol dehydrogenase [Bacteroidaceae bacterium]|nr:iron-containing alcohol dehydrogenase [Bacteroidaceae bacterium]